INSAHWQADVIQHIVDFVWRNHLANLAAHLVKTLFSCFEPCACWRAHVQPKLTSVNGREKIAPEKWDKAKRDQHKPAHRGEDNAAMIKTPAQRLHVTIAYFLERMVKPLMNAKEKKRYRSEDSCWRAVTTPDLVATLRRRVFFILRRASFNIIE